MALNTAVILLHQGLEALLKAKICQESPFLLIEQKKSEWSCLPQNLDIEFSALHQIGGLNLVITFFAINSQSELNTHEFYALVERIRVIRNEIIHVRPNENISVIDNINYCLEVMMAFYGKDRWVDFLRSIYMENPLYGYNEMGISLFWQTLNFIKKTIGRSSINNFLSINIKSRPYCCPSCSYDLFTINEDLEESKFSFLQPNEPGSTQILCLICGNFYRVKREKCHIDACKGNVFTDEEGYDDICLTCFENRNDILNKS